MMTKAASVNAMLRHRRVWRSSGLQTRMGSTASETGGSSMRVVVFGKDSGSLSSLRAFPFDKVKIDRTLVRETPGSPDNSAIVRAVATLAETLGMGTVAEGVETLDELNTVTRAGCNKAQGFFIGRPVPVRELDAVLSECVQRHSRAA